MRIGLLSFSDVDNYGDKLFGIIARAELSRRLPDAAITLLSPTGATVDGVEHLAWTAGAVDDFDGVILVGGEVIGADDDMFISLYRQRGLRPVADNPTDLIVAWTGLDIAYKAWFAVGAPASVSDAANQRIGQALPRLHHVSARGLFSKHTLDSRLAPPRLAGLVPDLGWLVPTQCDAVPERWRARPDILPTNRPYLVFQTFDLCLDAPNRVEVIANDLLNIEVTTGLTVVLLPITRCRDDAATLTTIHQASDERLLLLPGDLTVFETAAVLRGARAGICSSLHGALTCLSFGVPAAVIYPRPETKFSEVLGAQFRTNFLSQDWSQLGALATILVNEPGESLHRYSAAMRASLDQAFDRLAADLTSAVRQSQPPLYRLADDQSARTDSTTVRHLRHVLQERSTHLEIVQNQLAEMTAERTAAPAALWQRDADVAEKQAHVTALSAQVADVTADRAAALDVLRQRDADLAEKQRHIDALQTQRDALTTNVATLTATLDAQTATLDAQTATLDALTSAREATLAALRQRDTELAGLQARLTVLQSQAVSSTSSAGLVRVVARRHLPAPLVRKVGGLYRRFGRPAGRVLRRVIRPSSGAPRHSMTEVTAVPPPATTVVAPVPGDTAAPMTSPVTLTVDSIADEATFVDILEIGGWAASTAGPIARVEALLDGQPIGVLPYGNPRPDVRRHRQQITIIDDCGFHAILSAPAWPPGRHHLTVCAIDSLGNANAWEGEVTCVRLQHATGAIDKAIRQSTTLHVVGWALWPVQHPPAIARLSAGSNVLGQTRIHRTRPDVWMRFRTTSAAFQCGFRFEIVLPAALTDIRLDMVTVDCVDGDRVAMSLTASVTHAADRVLTIDLPAWMATIDAFSQRYGRLPAILDYATDLGLSDALPGVVVVDSPTADAPLPYLDRSIDLVAVTADVDQRLTEARRVAIDGVLIATNGRPDVDWLSEPCAAASQPSVSMIIATYNTADMTIACLRQTLATLPATLQADVIVIDDASTDDTYPQLVALTAAEPRIRLMRNDGNVGFLRSCNRAAATATGDVLVFLNSDTLPQPRWLEALLTVLITIPDAGAVGGKLIYPDGRLQEAGGAIFADGSGWNLGRGSPTPDAPLFNVLREVDYCSGALLATWRHLFEAYGGFDDRFAPMYYEDTDYCFGLRARGHTVYFQPDSVVIHLEGATAGTDLATGAKAYQVTNRAIFAAKWADELAKRPPPPATFDDDALYAIVTRGVPAATGAPA